MLIKKKINFALEFRRKGTKKNGNNEVNQENLPLRTIGKQVSFLKWFLRWCYHRGYHENRAFETFKPKLKSTQKKVIFLTRKELTMLVK